MKYLIPVFIIFCLMIPMVAQAARYVVCNTVPTASGQNLCDLLESIRLLLFYVGWGVAVIILIIGGIMYMSAGGDQEKVTKARKVLTAGVIGVVIILASSFILTAINEIVFPHLYPELF